MTQRNVPVLTTPRQFVLAALHAMEGAGRVVRHGIGLGLGALVGLAACSSSPATPQTFVHAQLGRATDAANNNLCNQTSLRDVLGIGTALGTCDPTTGKCAGSGVQRLADGAKQSGASTVQVSCSVRSGFDVNLNAFLGGMQGGTLTISGHVDGAGNGSNIQGALIVPYWGGTYSASNCTISPTYNGSSVPDSPPVATGRIWAHLSCPMMPNMDGKVRMLMDGTQVTETCDGEVDFIFENCSS